MQILPRALVLSTVLVAPAAAQGGWTHQAPQPTSFDVNDVQMLSPTEAFAVADPMLGDSAVVLHTIDGGQTWDASYPGTNLLAGAFFLDAQRGWAAGNGIFQTIDGGATWTLSAPVGSISDVVFVDAQHGYAVGNGGVTYRTSDGGQTWQTKAVGDITTLADLFFHDALRGWAVAIDGKLYRTVDGGVSWSLNHDAGSYLNTVVFFDDLNGWAIGGNTFLRTFDGGATWQPTSVPAGTWTFHAAFSDPLHGWAIGGQSVRTVDGGLTWQTMGSAKSYQDLSAIDFFDASHGMYGGDTGILMGSSDGGSTWSPLSSGGAGYTHGMDAIDALHAWAANDGGEVLRTVDGGALWERAYVPGFDKYGEIADVDFLDANLGWAVGTDAPFSGSTGRIVRSTDGGRTWTVQHSAPEMLMSAVDVVDAQTVYALGYLPGPGSGAGGYLMRTTNGGASWVTLPTTAFQEDVDFVDALTGWTVGGAVRKTTDGGLTWTTQYDPGGSIGYVEAVSFADASNGWFSGWDGVYHTTNGGATWVKQSTPGAPFFQPLKDIQAIDASTAWVVGEDGYAARTLDGGATWVQENFLGGFLYAFEACAFLDAEEGWVGGSSVFPQGGIHKRSGGPFVCQTDLGGDGHGLLMISMCGAPLSAGASSTLRATSSSLTANEELFIALSTSLNPTYVPLIKFTFQPWPIQVVIPAMLDGIGSFEMSVPGGFGPLTLYVQAVAHSPFDFSGYTTSNALQVEMLP